MLSRPFSVDAIMREPFFIPETMRVDLLMQALQERMPIWRSWWTNTAGPSG